MLKAMFVEYTASIVRLIMKNNRIVSNIRFKNRVSCMFKFYKVCYLYTFTELNENIPLLWIPQAFPWGLLSVVIQSMVDNTWMYCRCPKILDPLADLLVRRAFLRIQQCKSIPAF